MIFLNKSKEEKLLDSKSEISSMRYILIQTLELFKLSLIFVMGIVIYQVIDGQVIDWQGIAYFLAGFGTILTGTSIGKAIQKKGEPNEYIEQP